ncbi:hypothetical protein ACKI10_17185 [Streptomyces galilaeus]|uniref:Ferredoxin n=1 Tax=Streptomyces galilaeus TaxID=33899 RepID=A0ABW9IPT4_STRGJ
MSRVAAAQRAAISRVDEAYRRLSAHCLEDCTTCRANPRQACPEGTRLLRAWNTARREQR